MGVVDWIDVWGLGCYRCFGGWLCWVFGLGGWLCWVFGVGVCVEWVVWWFVFYFGLGCLLRLTLFLLFVTFWRFCVNVCLLWCWGFLPCLFELDWLVCWVLCVVVGLAALDV